MRFRKIGLALLTGIFCAAQGMPAAAEQGSYTPMVLEGKKGWLFPGWESLVTANTAGVDRCIDLIRQVHEELAARKINLIVLVVPMKALIYPERLPGDRTVSHDVLARYEHIFSKLRDSGIVAADFRKILPAIAAKKRDAFFRSDYHWTAWASEAAAALVAKEISENWKLAGKVHAGLKLGPWIEETRYGDLANLLPDDRRKQVGEETFTVREIRAQGNLLEENPILVEVVGNSFVQPYLGFTQKLSNELDRPVGLKWNYGNIGPWVTLLQFLQSQEFKAHKPQVVVWQFNEGQFMHGPNSVDQWVAASIVAPDVWLDRLRMALRE